MHVQYEYMRTSVKITQCSHHDGQYISEEEKKERWRDPGRIQNEIRKLCAGYPPLEYVRAVGRIYTISHANGSSNVQAMRYYRGDWILLSSVAVMVHCREETAPRAARASGRMRRAGLLFFIFRRRIATVPRWLVSSPCVRRRRALEWTPGTGPLGLRLTIKRILQLHKLTILLTIYKESFKTFSIDYFGLKLFILCFDKKF